MFTISRHANGLRTFEVSQVVQHAHADGELGRLRVDTPCPQAVTSTCFAAGGFMQQRPSEMIQDFKKSYPITLTDRQSSAFAHVKQDRAFVVWLTGISGAGKSTLANLLKEQLDAHGLRTCLLDGDRLREGLNQDLGFSDADRHENIRRTAEVAKLMVDAGLVVIAALISPFQEAREKARARFAAGTFVEVFVDVALDVAEARDPKGLYALARQGAVRQFTGIKSIYEKPLFPDVHVKTAETSPLECVGAIIRKLPLNAKPST